jgi:hypothetical protein
MSRNQPKPRADRIIEKLKNHPIVAALVVGAFLIGLISPFTDAIDKIQRFFTKPEQHTVSINCSPVVIPLRGEQGGSLYAIYLDPKWGNQLVFTPSASWPAGWTLNDRAYRCEVVNDGTFSLYGLTVVFLATFPTGSALPLTREIAIISPVSVEPKHSVTFYIADDTKRAEEVLPPESVSARVGDEKERRAIPVHYSTGYGRPVKLRGFNP